MAKGRGEVKSQVPGNTPRMVVSECPLFQETAGRYVRSNPKVLEKYVEFLKSKKENPTEPFGASDKRNTPNTPMSLEIPGIKHAHLTHNISVFSTLSGANPSVLRVYAILSHDEAGMGQPVNFKVQKSMAKRMANQNFQI